LRDREISSPSPLGESIVRRLCNYSRLSILEYLAHAKALPLSGKLVKPNDLPGGDFFSKGTHVLPLNKIKNRFEYDLNGFIKQGLSLQGIQTHFGDASITLWPFPRIPIVIILWAGDDEFPSRASMLFDSSCISHAATDILWSTAMMTIEMVLNL